MTAFRRILAATAALAFSATFAAAPAYAGLWSDVKQGAEDALKNPNLGQGAGRNVSDVDTSSADGLGQAKASGGAETKRAGILLGGADNSDPYKDGKMYGVGSGANEQGVQGARNLVIKVAKDLKNVLIAVAGFLLIIAVVRLIFSGAEEEEAKKLKTTVIWATLGIVVMQSSYAFVAAVYGKDVDSEMAKDFSENVLGPVTRLLEVLASFAFMAAAFYGFYKIITAQGEEDKVSQGKTVFINAALGFLALKLIKPFVYSLYGQEECSGASLWGVDVFKNCELKRNVGETVALVGKLLNWVNGFIAVVTVLLILYAGFLVLTSGGDEEKTKQAKGMIKYIVIGFVVLVSSYVLFRFFVTQDVPAN